jgi:hypothetical protein
MRKFRLMVGLALLTACHDPGCPKFDPYAYVGTWTLNVAADPGCWPAFAIAFAITREWADGAQEDRFYFQTAWWYPEAPANTLLVTGGVNYRDKKFDAAFNGFGYVARFEATNPTPSRVIGTFYDREGLFGQEPGCELGQAPAIARKQD